MRFTKQIFFVLWFCCLVFHVQDAWAQNNKSINFDSSKNVHQQGYIQDTAFRYPYSKKKVKFIAVANVAGYSAAMVGLYAAWYKNYPMGKFHTFNDIGEWKQIDKFGHIYSAYAESRASMELWRWTGIEDKKRIILGGCSGAAYQTAIEILDGFSTNWGFSWGDFGANIVGSGLLTAQEFRWKEQRIQLKFSFHTKHYPNDLQLDERSKQLFGTGVSRALKDYNGQTYWVNVNPSTFSKQKSFFPNWFMFSLGTGAEGLFGGYENVAYNEQTGERTFYRPDVSRYRQFFLSFDVDLTKIKTRKKGIKSLLNTLSIIKIPMPTLEISKQGFKGHWLYF